MDAQATTRGNASAATFLAIRIAVLSALAFAAIEGVAFILAASDSVSDALASLRYYTIQSNILVAGFSLAELWILARKGRVGPIFGMLRMASVIVIMVTGIVFALFLAGGNSFRGIRGLGSVLCHYIVPIASLLTWLAFSEKGQISLKQAPLWLAYPYLYVVYALIQGRLTGWYPYWFLNPSRKAPDGIGSIWGVLAFVGILSAAFIILGSLMVLADRLLGRATKPARSA